MSHREETLERSRSLRRRLWMLLAEEITDEITTRALTQLITRTVHGVSSRDRDGRGHDNDLNTNNDAANMFANDNNTGDGWGRSAWDNPLSPKPVEDDWTKQSTGDAWGSGPADNQGDNGNDFWGNKSYNDAWGSVDNRSNYSNHSNHGDNNANDNTNANDGGNVYNDSWGNWSNYGNPSQPITPDNSSDSCRKSSSGYTSYPQESNVMPSAVRRRGKMHNSGDEGKLNWVASPYPKKGKLHLD